MIINKYIKLTNGSWQQKKQQQKNISLDVHATVWIRMLFWVCVAQSDLKMQCLALWLLWSAVRSLLGIPPVNLAVANSHNNNTALHMSVLTLYLHSYTHIHTLVDSYKWLNKLNWVFQLMVCQYDMRKSTVLSVNTDGIQPQVITDI